MSYVIVRLALLTDIKITSYEYRPLEQRSRWHAFCIHKSSSDPVCTSIWGIGLRTLRRLNV